MLSRLFLIQSVGEHLFSSLHNRYHLYRHVKYWRDRWDLLTLNSMMLSSSSACSLSVEEEEENQF